MEFILTDEQKAVRESARKFAKQEIAPRAEAMDRAGAVDQELIAKMAELGYFGLSIPEEYGGSHQDNVSTTLLAMELSRGCAATMTMMGASGGLCGGLIAENGTAEQKQRYLPKIASAEWIGCMGMTEPEAGSDAFSIRTRAKKNGDSYILNGSKTFISNAPIADVAVVYATVDPALGTQGLAAFIVEKNFPGFSASKKFDKLGLLASPTGQIFLEDCEVPAENLLGGNEGQGWRQMTRGLNIERFTWSAMAVGVAKAALVAAFEYAQTRKQFGSPLYYFQMIQDKIATMATEIHHGELSCLSTAKSCDDGLSFSIASAMCKLFCCEMVMRVTTEAVQILGGYGYMRDYPVERYFRDAKVFAIGAGTSEIQKTLIAHQLAARGLD